MFNLTPKKLFLVYVVICYAVGVLSFLVIPQGRNWIVRSDFTAYYTGAKIVRLAQSSQIYNLELQEKVQKEAVGKDKKWTGTLAYLNPPIIVWLLSPLSNFSLVDAYRAYFIINVSLGGLVLYILGREVKPDEKLWYALAFYLPVFSLVYYAQAATYILLILALIYVSLKKGKSGLVGLLAALLFLKLQYLIMIPFIFVLVKDKWKFIKAFISTFIFLIAVNVLLYGPHFIVEYPQYLALTENEVSTGTNIVHNLNLLGIFYNWNLTIGPISGKILALIVSAILYAGLLLWFYKKGHHIPLELSFTIIILASMLLNIHTMPADLALLVLPFLLIWALWKQTKSSIIKYLLILIYIMPFSTFLNIHWVSTLLLSLCPIIILAASREVRPLGSEPA